MINWITNHLTHMACVILTSGIFLSFLLVQDIKHTSEKLILQKEYIELLDTNHKQYDQIIESVEMIKQRNAIINDLIKRYELLLKQLNGTANWAINNEKETTITIRGEKF